ncbi:bifunctional 3,4-dihydroxy-2-butanone-4-phosphate synthase/GTP cyclohydrolase II [Lactiplantibacillus plantarum]|uniref:Multifunctional fusion protein n=2 Tax=Lactiplantibacillus plantarum TaxID=1590 RepID=D1MLK2_LACPN|nr:bifunctional 3,4-dihydroxy-2-butanone-4-phosphate synthase/GTP cyclohydrolase II [Lactiplantibacillus plantarum]ACZ13322.1 putative rep protein [Lactiplantibacillus plantarum]ATL80163.1 bifunctional 3,4-dihydroxy-2-butanone-4-phosphate synthase/GTP cyclohydrolase II [Lactiplantibacillus plantarum]KKX43485.1 3,4-dihydroxy-2-butanone 4-phosphate synthase [Lactiplantibacillus plantarum]MCG0570029.1 bifunctional 3,4-dihydroxy-2-butanone-4-phosphate synthase/GTP cyclohydrolase II [Lactiplantibaci
MDIKKIQNALTHLKNGGLVIVMDDEDREAEGDMIGLASKATPQKVNFMTKYARGLMCVPMAPKIAEKLQLSQMTSNNTDPFGTAFTISVDHKSTTTGISAFDRWRTITHLADSSAKSEDFYKPGHIFPLVAKENGVLERNGHTEAAVDLAKLAGEEPVAYICEILKSNGEMARSKELHEIAEEYSLPIITIKELQEYRKNEVSKSVEEVKLPTEYGNFKLHYFTGDNLALIKGDISGDDPVMVRLHSECFTGDVLSSLRCDCGPQLHKAMQQIEKRGRGIILYLRQEGRGIGLRNKLKAYRLQEKGYDTVEANTHLGFKADERHYEIAAQILQELGVHRINLLTNNPDKIKQLKLDGIEIVRRLPLEIAPNIHDQKYLITKKQKFHHMLNLEA